MAKPTIIKRSPHLLLIILSLYILSLSPLNQGSHNSLGGSGPSVNEVSTCQHSSTLDSERAHDCLRNHPSQHCCQLTQTPSNITNHYQTSTTIKHHQAPPSTAKHHQTPLAVPSQGAEQRTPRLQQQGHCGVHHLPPAVHVRGTLHLGEPPVLRKGRDSISKMMILEM